MQIMIVRTNFVQVLALFCRYGFYWVNMAFILQVKVSLSYFEFYGASVGFTE